MTTDFVVDVDQTSFEREVIEESRRRPVVVDFWAPWCGPCRVLGPVLERLAAEGGGSWRLVKVNVDENQALASVFRIQGIPAVKAFKDAKLIDELTGALPEPQLRAWLERFVPGPADEAAAEGARLEEAGDRAGARAAYEKALVLKPRFGRALLGLARLDAGEDRTAEAERNLDLILPSDAEPVAAEIAALRLQLGAGGLAEAQERVARNPDDLEARVSLGQALAAAGQHEAALQTLLEVVKRSRRAGAGEDARKAMLDVFEAAGSRSELSDRYRSLLAQELYK